MRTECSASLGEVANKTVRLRADRNLAPLAVEDEDKPSFLRVVAETRIRAWLAEGDGARRL